jgi:hypothetical protein
VTNPFKDRNSPIGTLPSYPSGRSNAYKLILCSVDDEGGLSDSMDEIAETAFG